MTGTPVTVNGIPHAHAAAGTGADEAAALAAALAAAGHDGPILVVADNPAITRSGPAWARAFATRGWLHRVRVSTGIDGDAAALATEAEALALEARALRATVIVGGGSRATRAAAEAAAAIAGLPAVMHPALPAD